MSNLNHKNIISSQKSKSTTFRLDSFVLGELQRDANQNEISLNVLVNKILKEYIEWGFNNNNPSMLELTRILNQQLHQNERIEYLKLHGSVDWWLGEDNNIYHDFTGQNPLIRLRERMMIYPIYEKYISKEPFFTLYQYFRSLIFEDIVVIIGYSFADISINNAFIDWLTYKNNARLIVIANRNNQVRIRNIFGTHMNRIAFIEEYFGEDRFIDNLENLLVSLPVSN